MAGAHLSPVFKILHNPSSPRTHLTLYTQTVAINQTHVLAVVTTVAKTRIELRVYTSQPFVFFAVFPYTTHDSPCATNIGIEKYVKMKPHGHTIPGSRIERETSRMRRKKEIYSKTEKEGKKTRKTTRKPNSPRFVTQMRTKPRRPSTIIHVARKPERSLSLSLSLLCTSKWRHKR